MRKPIKSIILLLAGVVLGALPLFAANIFMRDYVMEEGKRQLEKTADHALARSEFLLQTAIDVFSVLPHYRVPVCDKDLQDRFRAMILRHPVLHDVGLIYNGEFMYCSSMQESASFHPISENAVGSVDHLSYVAVEDQESGMRGLLVKWAISEQVSIGGFILIDVFNLDDRQGEFAESFKMSVLLNNGTKIVETSPKTRLLSKAPFATYQELPEQSKDLITYQAVSGRYPVSVSASVPFQSAWAASSGAMSVINGFGVLTGALILLFFVRMALKKPDPLNAIEEGIQRGEFVPYYQPIIDIQSGRLAGCEVLVRWRKEDGTILSPGHFIDVAEATGLARPMTTSLMEQVANDLSGAYQNRHHLKVAINLFNRHFDDLRIVTEIEQCFGNSGVQFEQLVFEITERQPLENLDRARAIIMRMQKLGIRVALDDAGTGHGGFTYLQTLGMDIIKIDKLFVDAITCDSDTVPIVDSLSQMACGMNMVVVAEGVETEDQLAYLRQSGINEAQGYLFSPPLPASAYLKLVEALGGDASKVTKKVTPKGLKNDENAGRRMAKSA